MPAGRAEVPGSLRSRWSARPARQKIVLATIGCLGVAVALQAVSGIHGWHMVSDIPTLYDLRGIRPSRPPYVKMPVEYPVLIGAVMWLTSFLADSRVTYFVVNGAVLAGLAIVVSVALHRRFGDRARRWAAGVPLALYGFHNWDIVAVAPAVTGLIAFEAGAQVWAGILFGLGASAKLFPGLFIPPLVALLLKRGDRSGAARLVLAFAVCVAAVNLPVFLLDAHGWWYPVRFQGHRTATWGTPLFHLFHLPGVKERMLGHRVVAANLTSLVVLGVGMCAVTYRSFRGRGRGRETGELSPYGIGAAATAVCLLANKVYSPQYDLWMVPFFVLLPLSRRLWIGFCSACLVLYVLVFGHVFDLGFPRAAGWAVAIPVLLRAGILVRIVGVGLSGHEVQDRDSHLSAGASGARP